MLMSIPFDASIWVKTSAEKIRSGSLPATTAATRACRLPTWALLSTSTVMFGCSWWKPLAIAFDQSYSCWLGSTHKCKVMFFVVNSSSGPLTCGWVQPLAQLLVSSATAATAAIISRRRSACAARAARCLVRMGVIPSRVREVTRSAVEEFVEVAAAHPRNVVGGQVV